MHLKDFHYDLPDELIARFPLAQRSASRLLCLNRKTGIITHQKFIDLINLLEAGDLLVCNNSRVIPARLIGQKASGGRVEILVERILDENRILAQVKASKTPRPGSFLVFPPEVRFEVLQRHEDLFELRCEDKRPVLEVIETIGQIPIPPYFARLPDANDKERYQTIYAESKGSVAAPTAGLHFDADLLARLRQKNIEIDFVTLHVGAGTFASVRAEDITHHRMHAEYIEVSVALCEKIKATKARGRRVIAVGTTTARSLETACRSGHLQAFSGDTDIFIYPGYSFQCIDALITNFHLPCSTLLMLVCAYGGHEAVLEAYKIAVQERYRFFSYGDAMFIS
ncbi:MAG: S-adenosylmethionine tRNA ribosyltransferase [Gammaproteobacteria bacterium]|jgi:S-adenosylmethionine:tRNA ribosyltransferase-isomerase|nr:S-adenosylmethionine tRNA ribosyltransferase [Gammaproteobacteria bacterium]MCE3238834.1 S-adenosylmethionine tRNA ribosyltransferase [Gammaproteobacteria bacterium]